MQQKILEIESMHHKIQSLNDDEAMLFLVEAKMVTEEWRGHGIYYQWIISQQMENSKEAFQLSSYEFSLFKEHQALCNIFISMLELE
jgi:hypothetical protein